MIMSPRSFLIELYEEYLQEASFLYEQRNALLANPEITWRKIGKFEDRFEAHIDGLVIGGDLALDVCSRQAKEGDFGEAHAAVRVFCRQSRKDMFLKVLKGVDVEDAARVQAVADALKHELPESWEPELLDFLGSKDPNLVLISTEVVGYRRLKAGKPLINLLENSESGLLAKAVWALGRVGDQQARSPIFSCLLHGDQAVRSSAALALLRLGDEQALHYCLQHASKEQWAVLPLASGGSRAAFEVILGRATTGKASSECLAGLGLLGYPAAVPFLIDCLEDENTATAAADALDRIAGTHFQEQVFIAEEINEDELFEGERERLKQGLVPTRADGKPFGNTVNRVSQKGDEWQRWWDEHKAFMSPFTRYRNGVPYSPVCLVADLEQETTPHDARRLAYEELVIHYGLGVPFEADMFVTQQTKALVSASEWAQQHTTRFLAGGSYFSGSLISS